MAEFSMAITNLTKLQAMAGQTSTIAAAHLAGAINASVEIIRSEVVERTPVNTGILRGSVFTAVQGNPLQAMRGIVATVTAYAPPVEYGTKPHVIQGHGQRLRFMGSNGPVFRWFVRHPGSKGRHMFRDGLKAARPKVAAITAQAVKAAVAAIARAGNG